MMIRCFLRRTARAWLWGAAALSSAGAVLIVIAASSESLRIAQIGVALFLPVILVYYAFLGLLVVGLIAPIANTILAWLAGARRRVKWGRKRSAWSLPTPWKGVWDWEIDGW